MKSYALKSIVLLVLFALSLFAYQTVMKVEIPTIAYFGIGFIAGVFNLSHYFVYRDTEISENKRIRRFMLGSMIRLFFIVIFLAISLFNVPQMRIPFVVVYGIFFLLFLFFDILEMRTNLRPDLEPSNKKSNV
jgi:hypothetical protein